MNSGTLIFALIYSALLGFAGYRIGVGRGRPVLGAVLGFALGLIGLLIFICIPRTPEAKAARARAQSAVTETPAAEPAAPGPDRTP
jgi:hypothetical protein